MKFYERYNALKNILRALARVYTGEQIELVDEARKSYEYLTRGAPSSNDKYILGLVEDARRKLRLYCVTPSEGRERVALNSILAIILVVENLPLRGKTPEIYLDYRLAVDLNRDDVIQYLNDILIERN